MQDRSCKGKRYQELINSGQIATAVKKSKSSIRLVVGGGDNSDVNIKQSFSNVNNIISNLSNVCPKRTVSESENMLSYDLNGFDLEERIKELPALNLDDYLQRKRNTKKKKKFSSTGKKRGGQRGNTTTTSSNNNGNLNEKTIQQIQVTAAAPYQQIAKHHQQAAATAVGSQKRKARKESITRRDVAAIEQEAASLLPLTINGCCYFQEAPTALKYRKAIEKDTEATATATSTSQSLNNVTSTTSPIIPLQQLNSASSVSVDILNNISFNNNNTLNDNISSTSDLLILAEVAANRTELKH